MTSMHRRAGAEKLPLVEQTNDPPATAGQVIVYVRDVGGVSQLFARAGDGTVSKMSPGQTIPPVAGGVSSTARRPGAEVLRLTAVAADPAAVAGQILVYAKLVAGVAQLFTRDSAGNILQLTPHLTQAPVAGAARNEVRRPGAEILPMIARADDAPAIVDRVVLYAKSVNAIAQLFARLSDGTVALLSEGPLDVTGALPNQTLHIGSAGTPTWYGNFPLPINGTYYEWENGGAASDAQGLGAWQNSPVGAGAVRVALAGEPSWFQNGGSFSTGTTATGSNGTSRQAGIVLGPSSGLWSHDATFNVPTLSTGGESFYITDGWFNGSINPTLVTDGAYITVTHDVNGGQLQFITAQGSTRTTVNTGIAINAASYYHVRVMLTNNGLASFWAREVYNGGAWSDPADWGAPQATIATNIPSGTGQPIFASYAILKRAGTTARLLKIGYQAMYRVPAFTPSGNIVPGTGLQAGDIATAIGVDQSASPSWVQQLRTENPIVFMAYCRGAWIPSAFADFGPVVGGVPAGGATGVVADNNLMGMTSLNTSTDAAGFSFYSTSKSITLDATYVNPLLFESVLEIPTLSTGAQQFVSRAGAYDSENAPTRRITVEQDSATAANFQAIVQGPSGTTTVDLGVAATAGFQYLVRTIARPGAIDFYLVRNGVTALGAPAATITTNIPTGVTLALGAGAQKLAGTTSRSLRYGHLLAYQRAA